MCYERWLEQPKTHFNELLSDDGEYLQIANEALQAAREQSVALG